MAGISNVHDLPPYSSRESCTGPYVGFAFNKDGVRCKIEYRSLSEKLLCECGELCDQKLWQEADDKLSEHLAVSPKIHHKLNLQIQAGFALERPPTVSASELEGLASAARLYLSRSHDDVEDVMEKLLDVIEHKVNQIMTMVNDAEEDEEEPYLIPDYANTPTKKLLQAVTYWLFPAGILAECDLHHGDILSFYSEAAPDGINCIVDALVSRGELIKAKDVAWRAYEATSKCGDEDENYIALFLQYYAECAEVVGHMQDANATYKLMGSGRAKAFDRDFVVVKACPSGTWEERIARTQDH